MKFANLIAGLLAGVAIAGCVTDANYQEDTMSPKPAGYPSVDAGFLSALEWRFVGPYRGGRVVAVAGNPDDPLVHYFGAAHEGPVRSHD